MTVIGPRVAEAHLSTVASLYWNYLQKRAVDIGKSIIETQELIQYCCMGFSPGQKAFLVETVQEGSIEVIEGYRESPYIGHVL